MKIEIIKEVLNLYAKNASGELIFQVKKHTEKIDFVKQSDIYIIQKIIENLQNEIKEK